MLHHALASSFSSLKWGKVASLFPVGASQCACMTEIAKQQQQKEEEEEEEGLSAESDAVLVGLVFGQRSMMSGCWCSAQTDKRCSLWCDGRFSLNVHIMSQQLYKRTASRSFGPLGQRYQVLVQFTCSAPRPQLRCRTSLAPPNRTEPVRTTVSVSGNPGEPIR